MFKVLIVDDEPNMLAGLRRTLLGRSPQWDIRLAKDAREGLDLLREDGGADLVITDMRMPGMNGAVFLSQVKEDYPHTVRVVLSGYSDQTTANDSIFVAHRYLSKPSSPSAIVDLIAQAEAFRDAFDLKSRSAIAEIATLPSPPEVIVEWKHALVQGGDFERLEEIATTDIALGTKILQLANSSFFREANKEIVSMPAAISWLGVDMLHELHERGYLAHRRNTTTPAIDITSPPPHAARNGTTASTDVTTCARLLQDLGQLVINDEFADLPNPPNAEKTGHWLMTLWGIPSAIVQAVDELQETSRARQP